MVTIGEQITELRRIVAVQFPETQLSVLSPGASEQAIAAAEERLQIKFTEELKQLFRFVNGGHLGSYQLSTLEALKPILWLEEDDRAEYKLADMLNLGNSTWHFVMLYMMRGPQKGIVLHHDADWYDRPYRPVFDSLGEYYDFWIEAARRGLMMPHPDVGTLWLAVRLDGNNHGLLEATESYFAEHGFSGLRDVVF